jgi:hypothetical protein
MARAPICLALSMQRVDPTLGMFRAGGVLPYLAGPPSFGASMPTGPRGQRRPADVIRNAVPRHARLTGNRAAQLAAQ